MPLCDTPRDIPGNTASATAIATITDGVRTRRPARALVGALAALTAAGTSLALAGPAAAESQVSITDDAGVSVSEVVAGSVVHVAGTGFQSVQGGAGGIYVTFGWVDDAEGGTWRPTAGGATGVDYLYAPDVEGAENKGFQRYVAFPGSATALAANGGVIAEDGSWSADLTIPAAQFEALDRAGNPAPVDCAQVQCGFITVGAHGVKSATNETFTPVTFAAAVPDVPAEADSTDAEADVATDVATDATAEPDQPGDVEALPISAPVAPAEDDSAQRTFILSLIGGLLTIGALIAVGIVRAKRRSAAADAAAQPDADAQPDTAQPDAPSSGPAPEAGAGPHASGAGEDDPRS